MSTLISAPSGAGYQESVTEADLRAYFHLAGRPPSRWKVGAEFEKFAVERGSGRPLTYDEPGGIRAILSRLVELFGWEPHYEDGQLTTLTRGGATVSLEPGGQVELSTPPAAHVGEIAAHLDRHLNELTRASDPRWVAWLAAGVTPVAPIETIPLMPRPRHAVMAEYLPSRTPTGLLMMKATASTQVALDFADEADATRKFTTALKLGPIVNALWGNAPLYAAKPTGAVSYRGRVWQKMDPDRSGLLLDLLKDGFSFDRYVAYLLDVPMMFTHVAGRYLPARGRTFRDFLTRGQDGVFPTRGDWEVHLTTVFPEVRLKRFIEVRGADAAPRPLAVSVPALWKGLLYDADTRAAAAELARTVKAEDLPAVYEAAYRRGLAAEYAGRPLRAWCREIAVLAEEGLRRQAARTGHPDERRLLDPVFAVLDRGLSPGAEFLAHAETLTSPAALVRWFEYPE